MRAAHVRTAALGTTIGAALLGVTPVEHAQASRSAELVRESARVARGIPARDTARTTLLRRIAEAQIWIGDIDSALVTARSMGLWRREVETNASCRLVETYRLDDARQLVSRFPNEDRDWALAHLASSLVRQPWARYAAAPAGTDSAALHDRALAIAWEIRTPEARLDAFVSLAYWLQYWQDTSRVPAALDEALASLHGVRDRDRASSRLRTIITVLRATSRKDTTLVLLPLLLPRDRMADSVARHLASESASGRQTRQRHDVALTVVERAQRLAPTDLPGAIALVDTLADPLSYGRRARAYARVVSVAPNASRDTAILLLRRAREHALAQRLSPRQQTLTLLQIAENQIGRGLVDDAAATLNAIRDRKTALAAFGYLGGMRFKLPKADGQRLLELLGDPELRGAAAARVLDPWISDRNMMGADVAWATRVVDSLPPVRSSEAAQILVVRALFFRGDSAAASARALGVLRARDHDWTRWRVHPFGDELVYWAVRAGGPNEAVTWARTLPSPASRAAGLFEIGDALDAIFNPATARRFRGWPDWCRDEF